jgi:PAS domain S-box-containing protein
MSSISDHQYQWLFQRLPVMAALMDSESRFIDVSDEWVNRLGFSREEMRGKTPSDFATPGSARRISEEYIPQFRRAGRLDHVLVEFLTRTGERLDLLATTIAEYDGDGAYLHSLSVFTDITDRARIQRLYHDLYRATPAMLHTIDARGRITAVSDHWLMKLGYARDAVIGRSILDFMSDSSRQDLSEEGLSELMARGEMLNVPRQMVCRNGEVIDVLLSATAERDHRDNVVRLLVACKDVTARNRAESSLREAYGEIARLKEELERERDYLREEVQVSMNFGRIIGDSPALVGMLARIEAVAETSASVLIVGETGTGKELVAHAIHARSPRADGPLVKVNCASIPHELFESEFFGHVRGAFTGAHRDRVGRFELADGGTLFLDEIGEIPMSLQGKLLRVLQEKEFERVGEERTRRVDVRVVAATNRDLQKEVDAGRFREDLFYRLGVFPVQVPPLRKRGDDVVQLAVHFLETICREFGREVLGLTRQQVQILTAYHWPGNVRELKNVMERAVILSPGDVLRLDKSLPEDEVPNLVSALQVSDESPILTEAEIREFQRANTIAALEQADWRVSGPAGAAELLGVRPTTLADRIKALEIERPRAARKGRPARAPAIHD